MTSLIYIIHRDVEVNQWSEYLFQKQATQAAHLVFLFRERCECSRGVLLTCLASWRCNKIAVHCPVYVIVHVKDPQQPVMRVGHCVPVACFILSLYTCIVAYTEW